MYASILDSKDLPSSQGFNIRIEAFPEDQPIDGMTREDTPIERASWKQACIEELKDQGVELPEDEDLDLCDNGKVYDREAWQIAEVQSYQHWLEKDLRELYRKIDQGLLLYFCARVSASKGGVELGANYLGACIYKDLDDFVETSGYIEDMINEAVEKAKATIRAINA